MAKRIRFLFIAVLAALSALCIFSGCKLTTSLEDITSTKNLKAQVTYFSGGGVFSDNLLDPVKTLYFPAGYKPLDVGSKSTVGGTMGGTEFVKGGFTVDNEGYNLVGWYVVNVNTEGLPLYTDGSVFDTSVGLEPGKVLDVSDEHYLFDKALEENDHIYLCAKWLADVKLRVILAGEPDMQVVVKESEEKERTVKVGEELEVYGFSSSVINKPTQLGNNIEGFSFIHFYSDSGCEQLFDSWPIQQGEADEVLYAKFVENEDNKPWKVLKESGDVKNMFALKGENNYYLVKDIDCAGLTVSPITLNFKIMGNTFKISNLKVTTTAGNGAKISLFGSITDKARLKDITFDNLECNYTVRSSNICEIYLVYTELSEDAVIENVNISGKLIIKLSNDKSGVENIGNETSAHWLFGGKDSDADHTGNGFTVDATYSLN